MKRRARRRFNALLRDTRIIVMNSWGAIAAFLLVLLAGASILHWCYPGEAIPFPQALYTSLIMILGNNPLPYHGGFMMNIAYFLVPLLGLVAVGDGLMRFGVSLFNRSNRLEAWQMALAATHKDHIILCGLGKVGFKIWKELDRMGEEVVVIEKKGDAEFLEIVRNAGTCVLTGNAKYAPVLHEAGLAHAKALIAATNDDLVNLDAGLTAREVRPDIRVVLRMFDQSLADKIEKSARMMAFSTSSLSAPAFAYAAAEMDIVHSFYFDNRMLSIGQLTVVAAGELAGKRVDEVERTFDATIMAHHVKNRPVDMHPAGEVILDTGDHIAILADNETLARIARSNKGAR